MKCPECGFKNPDTTRFCGECGAELLTKKKVSAAKTYENCLDDNTYKYFCCSYN